MFGRFTLATGLCLFALACAPAVALAQSVRTPHTASQTGSYTSGEAASPLTLTKIDPPNWWAGLPKPMLLVRGEGLTGAHFALSDPKLHIEKTAISGNGHWAQLWLSASPTRPETVTVTATHNRAHAELPYTFAARRAATDGMAGFNARDVMYLIMTDRFADGDLTNDGLNATSPANSADAAAQRAKPRGWHGGDIRGVLNHLDYLQQLGITAVWLTPVYSNAGEPDSYHGYGATDLYAVDPHYGSLADLQALAKALHARGMKLVLDTVPNHIGPKHPWVTDEPTPNWFHGTAADHVEAQTDFRALINPHAPERDRIATLTGWFANILPDMDTDDPTVARVPPPERRLVDRTDRRRRPPHRHLPLRQSRLLERLQRRAQHPLPAPHRGRRGLQRRPRNHLRLRRRLHPRRRRHKALHALRLPHLHDRAQGLRRRPAPVASSPTSSQPTRSTRTPSASSPSSATTTPLASPARPRTPPPAIWPSTSS